MSHSFTLLFTHSRHAEQLLFSCLCSKVTLSLSHSLTLTLSHSHTHSHTLSFSHSLSLDMLNKFCFHDYAQKSLSHFHSLTLTLSHSHTLTLSFTHSPHAEQLLFSYLCSKVTVYSRKLQCFFWTTTSTSSPYPLTLHPPGGYFICEPHLINLRRGKLYNGTWVTSQKWEMARA